MKKIVIGVIILLIFQYTYFGFVRKPGNNPANSVTVNIAQGDSIKTIAAKLKKENVINSKTLFYFYAKFSGNDKNIYSGLFRIPLPQTIPSAVYFLTHNVPKEQKITIPEGYKISQIDALLTEMKLIKKGEFTSCTATCSFDNKIVEDKPLEGFLFPDTYFINSSGFDPKELIEKMLKNFSDKLPDLKGRPLYETIIMASIIEREVLNATDRQIVSGILYKRLNSDWPLGADATLLYEKEDNSITANDIANDSPYNTRKFKGLPPTPISNPGLKSIEAALNPVESKYWFYLTTPDTGEVIYATTNEEHNENKRKYL